MQAKPEMQPEDLHGTRTTEKTVMQSVDRAIEIVSNYMLNDYMEHHTAELIGLQKVEEYLLNSQEFECLQYVRKKLTPEAWEKFDRVVIKEINANTHEPDHEHIENNRPVSKLNMNNIYTDKPLFEDPSSLKHVRNGEYYEVKKHLLMVYMALKKVCSGPVLEDRLEHFIVTINYLLEANVCNLGWRNALYMLLNGVFPDIDIIPDMDQFMLNAMLDTISCLIDDYIKKNESAFMRVQ